jgi:ribosomal protein L11 methyltransferase
VPWVEVSIGVARADAAVAEQALEDLGALAVTLQDEADHPVLEPGPGETPLWPTVNVCGLFEADVDRATVHDGLQGVPGAARPGNLAWREVGDRDWERAWMDRFRPMRFGRDLWIVPTGMELPPGEEGIRIRLDPGLAFGTGTHPTTALCLEWLDGRALEGALVVDYGCGSGILAIAAALKGAARVEGVDNDPQALEATAVNAARNGVEPIVFACAPAAFRVRDADVVLANILAGPLIDLAPIITGCARPGADIVLSGLLEEQVDDVVAAYRDSCCLEQVDSDEGWARVVLLKS